MPALIIHGGAGTPRPHDQRKEVAEALLRIARTIWKHVQKGGSAVDCAVQATVLLENNPLFNAGIGSKLQKDGGARLSAALMDGERERFSGVVNVEGIVNPIILAAHLQDEKDRVLAGGGAAIRAAELGLEHGDVRTDEAIAKWTKRIEGATGTVGAVVLDNAGRIAAATSTGGRGMERVGRVSDSATVAGNFATPHAGMSCTGIGEDIVNGSLASRLVTTVETGVPMVAAAEALIDRMKKMNWEAGFIAMDKTGKWVAPFTTEVMYWTAIDEFGEHQFADPESP